jgi:hypothetical protein
MDSNRWGPPVRVSVRPFLEWVPGPGRYRKPILPVQASSNFISLGTCVTTRRLVLPQREANRSLPFVPKGGPAEDGCSKQHKYGKRNVNLLVATLPCHFLIPDSFPSTYSLSRILVRAGTHGSEIEVSFTHAHQGYREPSLPGFP